jgi:mannose/fructose/N-acetylgalactosamine-specific phosphotransferase system component IID
MVSQGYSLLAAIILGIWGGITMYSVNGTTGTLQDPIVTGLFTGLIVHNVPAGLAVGATLELMSLGLWTYGGTLVPDFMSGALIGTAVAALSKGTMVQNVATGIAVAVPVSLLMSQLDVLSYSIDVALIHGADRYCETENEKGMIWMHWLGLIPQFFSRFIPITLAIWLGAAPLQTLISRIPTWLINGLGTMGAILPAVGFGILLTYLPLEKWWSFLVMGFVCFAYLNMPLIGIAAVAFAVVFIYSSLKNRKKVDESATDVVENTATADEAPSPVTRRDFMKTVWRHNMSFEVSWNYERMQALGFTYSMMPVLRKIYPDKDEYFANLKRHLQFFNSNTIIGSPIIMGAVCALEEKKETALADNLKIGLMGPFAGIGDTVVAVLMKPIFAVFAASLALSGHSLGAVLMLFLGLCWFYFKFVGFDIGHRQGAGLVKQMAQGSLDRITEGASQIGLFVIGGFIPSILSGVTAKVQFIKKVVLDGKQVVQTVKLQDTFDKILPYAIPLMLVFLVYWLVKQKHWKILNVLLLVIVLGIVLGAFRIL